MIAVSPLGPDAAARLAAHPLVESVGPAPAMNVTFSFDGHRRLIDEGLDRVVAVVIADTGIAFDRDWCVDLRPPLDEFTGDEFPRIVSARVDGPRAEIKLVVEPGVKWFRGHFPGHPVLAGVVQVHWAGLIGRRLLAIRGRFAGARGVKFQNIVEPGIEARLELVCDESGDLHFCYDGERGVHSRGRLIYQ